jgi:nucleoside-diphosphate-sugar epimerase
MPNTLIFGGSGKVARRLTTILTSQNPAHTVYSVIRNPAQTDEIKKLGGVPVIQSIEDSSVDDLAATLKKHSIDSIVWSAGAGGGSPARTVAVDKEGAIKSFDAAAKAGVHRYVMVSANDVRDRSKPAPEWYDEKDKERSDKGWGAIEHYMQMKFEADKNLRTENEKRGLEYTIVRPGALTVDPGQGTIKAGKVHLGSPISREDVAAVVAEVLNNDGTIGLAFDILGGDTPIKQAVQQVVEKKEDTFEGQY